MRTCLKSVKKPKDRVVKPILWLLALFLVCAPALIRGEILNLMDGSSIKGKVVSFAGDTLTFDADIGTRLRVSRSQIASIVFDETAVPAVGWGQQRQELGNSADGFLEIGFEDDKVSSKIVATKKNEEIMAVANRIIQMLVVDGENVFSIVDSTTDKTVYKGHIMHLKNNAKLVDMKVALQPGAHQCVVIAISKGVEDEGVEFETDPLDMSIELDNVQIFPGKTTRIVLGIKKGKLRFGKPVFYRVR